MRSSFVFLSVLACLAPSVPAQTVVAAHSGVVNYFEGSVLIDGQALEHKSARFDEIKPGSEFQTNDGRAEILLTPGVILRVDENSSFRMVSNKLTDTRLEFLAGAAILDSRNAAPGDPITIAYKNFEMRFAKSGRYRLDSEAGQLQVAEGEVDVKLRERTVAAKAGQVVAFASPLAVRAAQDSYATELDRWDHDRSASISADNQSAADSDNLSNALNDPNNAAGTGGGGYGSGYYGGLIPDPVASGGYYSGYYANSGVAPLWLYPGAGFGFIPFYVRVPSNRFFPTRTGTLHYPARTYTPPRTGTSTPVLRTTAPPRLMPHPIGHR